MYEIKEIVDDELEQALELCFDELVKSTAFRKFQSRKTEARRMYVDIAIKYHVDNSTIFYGLFEENNLVGVIEINGNYINQLVIKDEYQNKGLGTLLFNYSVKENDDIMVDAALEVVGFYEKLGFVKYQDNGDSKVCVKMKRVTTSF